MATRRLPSSDLKELMYHLIHARERNRNARGEVCKSNPVTLESHLQDEHLEIRHKRSIQELIDARREYNRARAAFAIALTGFRSAC